MGTFDYLPVYTLTRNNVPLDPDPAPNFGGNYPFLEPWIYGLLESFPTISREEIKSYILSCLRASIFSDLDSKVDQIIVKYYIEKYC